MVSDRLLRLLFSRLTWPSPLARERACVEIGRLLTDPDLGTCVRRFTLDWLRSQEYESVCGLGLLALIRAKAETGELVIPTADMTRAVSRPSVQSTLLLRDYDQNNAPLGDLTQLHSGEPPSDFTPHPFFGKFVQNFLPPIYNFHAGLIEQHTGVAFTCQWAYEWDTVRARRPVSLSTKPLDFWLGGRAGTEPCYASDMRLSEVYRSAFLRALAWVSEIGRLDCQVLALMVADTVPINLDLWQLPPERRPEWWPCVESPTGELDTGPAGVWNRVEALGRAPWGPEWLLAAASGHIGGGRSVFDLSVVGICYKRHAAEDPELSPVLDWCATGQEVGARPVIPDALRFGGAIDPVDAAQVARNFAGWSLVPAAARVNELLIPSGWRWQWWRDHRGLWSPAPWLADRRYEFAVEDAAITYRLNGEVVARWADWTDGLRERLADGLQPATGQVLLVRKSLIDSFSADTGARYGWLAGLHGSCRKHHYEEFEHFDIVQAFGVSPIVLL